MLSEYRIYMFADFDCFGGQSLPAYYKSPFLQIWWTGLFDILKNHILRLGGGGTCL